MAVLFLLLIVGGLAYRMTSADQRARVISDAIEIARTVKTVATRHHPEYEVFRDTSRARTRYVIATPVIIAIEVLVGWRMLAGAGAWNDPHTLIGWGASFGPRTSNGEWWRLLTSSFIHSGGFQVVIDAVVILQLGVTLERLLGPFAVALVFLSSGAFASLANLSAHPAGVTTGTAGAIFGLYGLLAASLGWHEFRRRSPDDSDEDTLSIPVVAMRRLGVVAIGFLVFSVLGGRVGIPEWTGFVIGLAQGIALAMRISHRASTPRQLGSTALAAAALAVICAVELAHIADVKPEIARVVATEERTAATYQTALDAFKHGRMTAESLADVAERTIVPELQAEDARLEKLRNVPPEYQPLITDARAYLRLRSESWRVRATALRGTSASLRRAATPATDTSWRLQTESRHRSNMMAAGKAEGTERASLEVFERVKALAPEL